MPPPPSRTLEPGHTEQVNALAVWPDGRLIASAGDDGAIRLWKPDDRSLVGILATDPRDGSWVAYDPEGRFDSSPGGEAQVSYSRGHRILSLAQYGDVSRVFGLGSHWLDGTPAPGTMVLRARPPAGLAIELSSYRGDEVGVTVHLGEASPSTLRVHRNDHPVLDAEDFRPTSDPLVKTARVSLASGENRFVATGSRPEEGAVIGRSNVESVPGPAFDPARKGVVHTLAIGISDYKSKNALRFADNDASDVAAFLDRHGIRSPVRKGLTIVLKDREVRPASVEKALLAIRDRARPEDAVVLFVAGHTDVRRDRFCLLLDTYPFGSVADDSATTVPYASMYRLLARMNAEKRLVVIDACQAGAIFDDQGVRRIREKVDDGAHRAGTSYLLAARRGEAANEAVELRHGLFTHLLLRGMGANDLEDEPGGRLGNADLDGDGEITTEELRQFVIDQMPRLASRLPEVAARARPDGLKPLAIDPTRVDGASLSFPLTRLP